MRSLTGFNSNSAQGAFSPGQPIFASSLNELAISVDKTRTMPSNDLVFNAGTGGTAYSLPQQVYEQASGGTLDPSVNGDKVTVVPGTVNRYIPKIGADYIDKIPRPQITVTDNGYILVKVTYEANKYFPRTAEIVFLAVSSPPADTENESYYPLSKVNKTTSGGVDTYTLDYLGNGNLIVNRLKSGQGAATWWWDVIK